MAISKSIPFTQEYLHSILNYDPETGIFVWKERTDVPAYWNPKFANTVAGTVSKRKYISIIVNKSAYKAHRLAWFYITGDDPVLSQIDHIDMNCGNNAIYNLRLVNNSQNKCNSKRQANNTSGYRGVCKEGKKWVARIKLNNKLTRIGLFDDPYKAHVAYEEIAKHMFGDHYRPT